MDTMAVADCTGSGDSAFPVVDRADVLQEEYVEKCMRRIRKYAFLNYNINLSEF